MLDLAEQEQQHHYIERAADMVTRALRAGYKVITCGNGGSMCDAMHFAEELTGRFRRDRRPLQAVAISDPAHITCVANDYGFSQVFSRWVEAHGRPGDVLVAISVSGASQNIINALKEANRNGVFTIALVGSRDCPAAKEAVHTVPVGGLDGAETQEAQIMVLHMITRLVEDELLGPVENVG